MSRYSSPESTTKDLVEAWASKLRSGQSANAWDVAREMGIVGLELSVERELERLVEKGKLAKERGHYFKAIPRFPTWNEVMKEGENSPIRYAQRARVEVTYKDVDLKVRPSVSAIRTAKQFRDIPVAVTQEDIDHAYKDHLKAERFRMFCEEEGIPGGRKEMPDGSVEFYAPDAMGYPTHVLTQYPNGETS
jgi:hypothetical protein